MTLDCCGLAIQVPFLAQCQLRKRLCLAAILLAALSLVSCKPVLVKQTTISPRYQPSGINPDLYNAVGLYTRFDTIFPAHVVGHASIVSQFVYASVEPNVSYSYNHTTRTLASYTSRNPVTGLLIAKNGRILMEHYQYGCDAQTRFHSQSVAKTVVAMLVGVAIQEHLIRSVEDRAEAYVRELTGSAYGSTTIRDLLHMASGVHFLENNGGQDDLKRLNHDLFFEPNISTTDAILKFNSRDAPSGTRYYYASIEPEILGLVLNRATGRTVSQYLSEKLWMEIGTEQNASWVLDVHQQEITYCSFNATLRDYARFGQLLAQNGQWERKQLIPSSWIIDATTVRPADQFLAPGVAMPYFGYGYLVRIFPGNKRIFEMHGLRGQCIFVDPDDGLVMVQMGVFNPMNAEDEEALALWNALVANAANLEYSVPVRPENDLLELSTPELGHD